MAKLSLGELKKLREDKKTQFGQESGAAAPGATSIEIIVGMGTCGIAAGAKQTYEAIAQNLEAHSISASVRMRQTGCMGLCYVEPTVEVAVPGMPRVIYGKMTADIAKDLVQKHLVGRRLLNNHIYDRPAVDIIEGAK